MSDSKKLDVDIGKDHIVIQRRYDALGAVNDLLIAIWFLIGSSFFLKESLTTDGTWLFILGSAQLLIKPLIKLISLIHAGRVYNRSKQR
ncbi:MAG: YrhK family protein [Psychrobacter sp.]|uniref:YrhK family protein n=1 Tax=Psychrobacter sp. TaxID=56811 RepID=UPI002647D260|nr:YrhK family protein [Psychrobacter sp.]MDN5620290.1 YrhK family protein [Psychrobacter sp.]